MSAPDLHPEELLDRAARGELSAEDRAHLDAHLAACAVCRFEQAARADFAAAPTAGLSVDNLVARALAGLPQAPARPVRTRRTARTLLVAAALVGTFAAAAQYTGAWPAWFEAVVKPQEPAPQPQRPPSGSRVQVAPPPALPEVEPPVVVAPEPAAPRAPPVVVAAPRPAPVAPAPVAPDAAALFARANEARVRGEHVEAVQAYRVLLNGFPEAPEARLTHAMLGRLLLDMGDASGAMVELDAYLREGDETLREEVLAGRATALQRLGQEQREVAAWRELLAAYPESIHGARARARLGELKAQ